MLKNKFIFSTLLFISALFFATIVSNRVALAQSSWMNGLNAVRMFNSVHDNRWMRTWEPNRCFVAATCALHAGSGRAANDPDPVGRPGVKSAIRGDTCPSAHDIDCDNHPRGCSSCGFGVTVPGRVPEAVCTGPY